MLRRGYEDWNAGGLDAVLELLDPRIDWRSSGATPDAESFSGHDGVRRSFAKQEEVFEAVSFVQKEIVAHDDRVLATVHISARGRGSGATVEMTMFHFWTLEHGRAVRLESFVDRDTALEVADFE